MVCPYSPYPCTICITVGYLQNVACSVELPLICFLGCWFGKGGCLRVGVCWSERWV
jgi:hypothetical protein